MTENLPVIHSVGFSFADMRAMAQSIANSRLFGIQNPDQALTLMLVSQAEGRHPALAARDYDIVQGKPTKKAEAMQRDFLSAGGHIKWNHLDDAKASATFSHPVGGSVTIDWDMARAQKAGLAGKDLWKKYPRNMLRARVVSEGVRTVFPAATSGMYVPEEAHDMKPDMVDVTPPHDEQTGEIFENTTDLLDLLRQQGEARAALGRDELREWFAGLDRAEKKLIKPYLDDVLKQKSIEADNAMLEEKLVADLQVPSEIEAQAPLPAPEQPAVEPPSSGGDRFPPAEDSLGLPPLSNAEAFCNEMLTQARGFTVHAAFDNLKNDLGDGRTMKGREAKKLDEKVYWSLISQIDAIEQKLSA